jgi:hypothetical protein
MRLQVVFAFLGFYLLSPAASGSERCFDFNSKVLSAIRQPIPRTGARDASRSGKLASGVVWGAARGDVKGSLQEVLKNFYDHNLMKSNRVSEMNVVELERPQYLARHEVTYKIKPFPFVTVEWTEDWAYQLVRGTAADPSEVVIAYEKVKGTSYIEHLCGNIVLRKDGANATDVFLYEETKATQRDEKDTVGGLLGTLGNLRTVISGGGGPGSSAASGGLSEKARNSRVSGHS